MVAHMYTGDCRSVLATLPAASVQCVVTSPPYWAQRDYDVDGQIGHEATSDEYVASMIAVFRGVRRVLQPDGTLWLVLGDGYQGKQLLGLPWRVALALQSDGWYLRSDIIWHKPNAHPESVRDRPTQSHEYVFLLSRSRRYLYNADAVMEPLTSGIRPREKRNGETAVQTKLRGHGSHCGTREGGRNRRTVWSVSTHGSALPHVAMFPRELVEPCVLAGSRPGDTVLDPFAGSGTVGLVAQQLNRTFVGIELNPGYAEMASQRLAEPIQQRIAS